MNDNDPIRQFQSDLQVAHGKAEALRPLLKSCQEAVERCGKVDGVFHAITVTSQHGLTPVVSIIACVQELAQVTPLFRELAKEGQHTNKSNPFDDCGDMPMRRYQMQSPSLAVMVLYSGEKCQKVQVGTKEIPVYEVKCGESAESQPELPNLRFISSN